MDTVSDRQLILRAQEGDRDSFAALVDRHYPTVYRYAFRWCRTREDAEDIAQEVFIRVAGKIGLFDGRSRFTTWLYTITANCARDHARKNRRWVELKAAEPPDDELAASANPGPEQRVFEERIRQVIDSLPDRQRQAMLLVYAEGLSHKEAARVIGCAETTVSWRLFQAKRKLKKVLS